MWDWLTKLEELRRESTPVAVVTVASVSGSTPREIGAKMLVLSGGRFFGTIGGGNLEKLALDEAAAALEKSESRFVKIPLGSAVGQCCGGMVGLLVEVMNRGPRLYVFGAGHVGRAICQVLAGTSFEVHLIDERRDWLLSPEIPSGVTRHWDWGALKWDGGVFAVVLTHSHALDQAIVAAAVEKPFRYLGLIGSRTKWERFRSRLGALGISREKLDRVVCPIGLPLGGKSPKEIAVSFAAQVLEILNESQLDSACRRSVLPDGDAEGIDEPPGGAVDSPPAPGL